MDIEEGGVYEMFKLFKYLKSSINMVFILVFLLILQASCELSLPAYTSDIVNVGIALSGVEDTVPVYLSDETYMGLTLGASEEIRALVSESYSLCSEGYYVLNENADWESIREVIVSMMPKMAEENIDSALGQFCVAEYKKAGIDLSEIQLDYILKAGAKMLLLAFAVMISSISVGFIAARVGAKIGWELRGKVFKKVVGFSNAEIENFSTASLITRSTNDIQQVQMVTVILLRMVLYAPIIGIGGVVRVLNTDVSMSYIIVVAIVCVSVVMLTMFVVAMPKFKLMQKLVDRVNLVAREVLTGLPVIRAFSREKFEEERFEKANKDLMKTQLFTNRAMSVMMPVMTLIMNGVSLAIIWFGAKGIDAGNLMVGDMMAFMTYSMQIIMSFLMITMISIMLPRAGVAAERIEEVLNTENSITDATEPVTKEFEGEIIFDDVSFSYPDARECVIENISFTAKPGETTAIIGSTGSGKSTLLNLIPRFFDVTKGKITVDGVDIRQIDKNKLREMIGYVPQKAVLFSGTIESNIKYGCMDASDEVMENAARIAQSVEFIETKESKYNSSIAQGGANVSGGQKQRLSIARAIARNPKIYLFDDSFSALDFKTDAALRKELAKVTMKSTVIIVAQRVSTILHADKIIVLDEGKVVGAGNHKELMNTCEVYREIAKSQLSQADIEVTLS